MRRRTLTGVIFLAILVLMPAGLTAQDPGSDASPRTSDSSFELQQNYPNPFNPTTRIPFVLQPSLFDSGQPVRVTMRIFNVLQQLVAHPTALNHPGGGGGALGEGLEYYSAGQYEAFWDGRDINGNQVASGMYYLQVTVNGQRKIMKMIVQK